MIALQPAVEIASAILIPSIFVSLLIYRHERKSDREAPLKLAVILAVMVIGFWVVMGALSVLSAILVRIVIF